MYKKISAIESEDDYYEVTEEFIDRYGEIPQSVLNLLDIGYIKCLAGRAGISEIVQKGEWVELVPQTGFDGRKAVDLINSYHGKIRIAAGEKQALRYRFEQPLLDNIKIILQKLI